MSLRENTPIQSDLFQSLNDPGDVFKNPEQLRFVRTLIDILRRAFINAVRSNQAVPSIILTAPNGTSWVVEVGDTGALSTRNARA